MRRRLRAFLSAWLLLVVAGPDGASWGCSNLAAQQPAAAAGERLFDGRTLDGWDGDPAFWSVRDGCIVGSTAKQRTSANTFLIWRGEELVDFEFTCKVRLEGDNNSGVQYRSRRVRSDGFAVHGYQCDVHPQADYCAMLYEEGGRGIVARRGQQVVCGSDGKPVVRGRLAEPTPVDLSQWRELRITARGRRLVHELDGVVAVEVDDESASAARAGILALQVHSGAPMTVWFKDLVLRRLPTEEVAVVAAPAAPAQPTGPTPQWIWHGNAREGQEVFFRRQFTLPAAPRSAHLAITCDNHFRIFVNGERRGASDTWETPRLLDVTKDLRGGDNAIAVQGWNDGGPAGLCLRLSWTLPDGEVGTVVSDAAFRVSDDDPDDWYKVGFADAGWAAATVLAPLGGGPWGATLSATAFTDMLVDDGPQPPAPAAELRVPVGYRATRLLRVPRIHGSWVCLARGPQDDLYASDQRGGLFRIVPARDGGPAATTVERLDVALDGCQGLLWAHGALYAVANVGKSGLYRLRDTDGDGRLDQVELLRALRGSGEHGPHAVELAPDGRNLLVLCGNHTLLPELARSRLPRNWQEDRVLPKVEDANGHAVGIKAPGGYVCLVDPDGREWELLCAGFRNAYDLAVLPDGEIVTYDADMEWDMGLPWYRPTRILHVLSGVDYGWRSGASKWPADLPDALPAIVDVGPGSPTGMAWDPAARAVLALDWTFGTVYHVALREQGASLRGALAEAVVGIPLPVADVVVDGDGFLLLTGGRGIPSTLYRVQRTPAASSTPASSRGPEQPTAARAMREMLERYHGRVDERALDVAWPQLGAADPVLRHAARIAIESQPVATWRERALASPVAEPWAALHALLALAKQGAVGDVPALLDALAKVDFRGLDEAQRIAWLRVHEVALARHGVPTGAVLTALQQRLLALFPSGSARLDRALVELLAAVDAPGLLERVLPMLAEMRPAAPPPWLELAGRNPSYGGAIRAMLANMPPTDQLAIAWPLRMVRHGWTLEQREQFFRFVGAARQQKGGASYDGYLKGLIDAVWSTCTPAEQQELALVVGKAKAPLPAFAATAPKGPGRRWQLDEAMGAVQQRQRGRDYQGGRNLFHATSCAACHRFGGEGGSTGPDLSSLGNKFTATDVLEAILEPSKVISDQYGGMVLTKRDGSTVFGRAAKALVDGVEVWDVTTATATAERVRVPAADVLKAEPAKLSPMPAGLVDALNADELADLVAYLLSRGDPTLPSFRQ